MVTPTPRLVIAAPASGSGKTTVATGLMAAFTERGLTVSPHKVGPDYIDPGYHALATGRPGRNLDAFLCGTDLVAPLFAHGATGCDLAVVEGVMGLYDGASGRGDLASTAQVAALLRAPVVLVVDASAQSRSVAALVHGFASWDPAVRIGGVILNKVGSERHETLLREALDASGVPVLGALHRTERVSTPSRHLGLVPVAERRADALDAVRAMAGQVREGCDLAALLALARTAGRPATTTAWDPAGALRNAAAHTPVPAARRPTPPRRAAAGHPTAAHATTGHPTTAHLATGHPTPGRPTAGQPTAGHASPGEESAARGVAERPVVAVAGGPAFTFTYAEHVELLTAAGADVAYFDPLRDEALPDGTAGLVIGGGFPEVFAPELSANEPLRRAVGALARSGAPVAAECAGLLYLSRSLDGAPMCGVLDAEARMTPRLTLGYREAVAVSDSVLAATGTRMRGHEFHRTVLTPGAGPAPAWGLAAPERRVEGFVQGGVHAAYLHTHWAGRPDVALRFTRRCAST